MSRGKHLSLEEARRLGKLGQFAKEHPSVAQGDNFDRLLTSIIKGSPEARQTSSLYASGDCSGTQTLSRISEGASSKREHGSRESTASAAPKTPQGR